MFLTFNKIWIKITYFVRYVGINASDVIMSKGTGYYTNRKVPYGIGFEVREFILFLMLKHDKLWAINPI